MRWPLSFAVPIGLLVPALLACETAPAGEESRRTPQATADRPARAESTPKGSGAQGSTAGSARQPSPPQSPPGSAAPQARRDDAPTMVRASMRIPAIGLPSLPVIGYRGSPDDGPGTRIQNGGVAASPVGDRGGVGPGQVGNYIVTAHRTTPPAPFADLPSLRQGEHVLVTVDRQIYDYRVTDTRSTSFRSRRSLARQSAAVPGRPGVPATRAMITLSTCATPEDHAAGNFWADEFDNPEHRIDKVGVLVEVRRARP